MKNFILITVVLCNFGKSCGAYELLLLQGNLEKLGLRQKDFNFDLAIATNRINGFIQKSITTSSK